MLKYFISFSNRIFKYKKIFKCIVLIIINICLFFEVIKKNYLTLKNKISTRNIKVCLCIMGKEENLYAKEHANWYKKLGYNHIFLYDNNDIDGERFEEVLQEEIKEGFISILNYRGYRGEIRILGGPQLRIYYDCYDKNNKDYDWLSFYDFDEFLELYPKNTSIQQFLGNKRYKKCQNIKINFLFYSDNELLYYDKRPVQERFKHPLLNNRNNVFIKSTVRGGLKENYWNKSISSHSSLMNYTSCNSLGEFMQYDSVKNRKINYKYAVLKHYYTKSVEEYANKTKRGEAFFRYIDFNKRKARRIDNYFFYNRKTKKKIKLFKKLFSIK